MSVSLSIINGRVTTLERAGFFEFSSTAVICLPYTYVSIFLHY